jgi:hypothetical protein
MLGDVMRSWPVAMLAVGISAGSAFAQEEEPALKWGAVLDLRAAHGSSSVSWLEGGLGKTRYGALDGNPASILSVGQASLVADARLTEVLAAHVHANFDVEPDREGRRARAGLVEAFATFRPEPTEHLRLRFKGGLFFPAISFEHPGKAWTTVFTITPSALNAWVGEELRSTGLESVAAWRGERHEGSVLVSLFSNNDPAGTLLAWRGWAMHDRQTAVFDQLPLAPLASFGSGAPFHDLPNWVSPIREVDGRIGYQAGLAWSTNGVFDARASYWDNRADPAAFDGFQYGWYSEVWNLGARVHLPRGAEAIAQYMDGTTEMGEEPDGTLAVDNRFRAAFVLLTGARGRHRLTARYDWFDVEDRDATADVNTEDGSGWTIAYLVQWMDTARFAVEWLQVTSTRPSRADLEIAPHARETQVQASLRFTF